MKHFFRSAKGKCQATHRYDKNTVQKGDSYHIFFDALGTSNRMSFNLPACSLQRALSACCCNLASDSGEETMATGMFACPLDGALLPSRKFHIAWTFYMDGFLEGFRFLLRTIKYFPYVDSKITEQRDTQLTIQHVSYWVSQTTLRSLRAIPRDVSSRRTFCLISDGIDWILSESRHCKIAKLEQLHLTSPFIVTYYISLY